MKKFKILFSLTSLFFVLSCTESNLNIEEVDELNKAKILLLQKVKMRYNIEEILQEKDGHFINYEDRSELFIKPLSSNSYLVKGSKLSNSELIVSLNKLNGNYDLEVLDINSKDSESQLRLSESPCEKHPEGETFKECYNREKEEFCDGFWTCLALDTQPIVVILIALHCKLC
jgi:hypothetical protein